jgi:hypothetical protein
MVWLCCVNIQLPLVMLKLLFVSHLYIDDLAV